MSVMKPGRVQRLGLGLSVGWMAGVLAVPATLSADVFHRYSVVETFALPAGAGPMTVMPDGRVMTIVNDELFAEDAPGSRVFVTLGTLPGADMPFFGAAFVAVSPDQTKVAVGNNGSSTYVDFSVGVFDLATLSGDWFPVNHFLGTWLDNTRLVLADSDFFGGSTVTVLDTTSPDPGNPISTVIVQNIGGASGGFAFDAGGNLFVANGYSSFGPSGTGAIKVFTKADVTAVLSGGLALDFEATGTLVLDILSGTPLGFDDEGNLFAGGGADPPDNGFLALTYGPAVAEAAAGMEPIDPADTLRVRRLDPDTALASNRYSAAFNPAQRELYVRDINQETVYVYADFNDVPTVSQWGLASLALLMTTAGTLLVRFRVMSSAVATGR
ncbi:MAG: hypothetical protein IH989_06345 [Planctomycetes bacterium]|nr:hypothetical protein [Planctomycetota bacterium]